MSQGALPDEIILRVNLWDLVLCNSILKIQLPSNQSFGGFTWDSALVDTLAVPGLTVVVANDVEE